MRIGVPSSFESCGRKVGRIRSKDLPTLLTSCFLLASVFCSTRQMPYNIQSHLETEPKIVGGVQGPKLVETKGGFLVREKCHGWISFSGSSEGRGRASGLRHRFVVVSCPFLSAQVGGASCILMVW